MTDADLAHQAFHMSLAPLDAAWDPTLLTEDSDEYCWTPLQLAARGGELQRVKEILAANPSAVNDPPRGYYGQTALQAACMHGHEDVVELLLAAGADIHFCGGNNFQRSALQIACGQGNEKIVEMLLKGGAEVNTTSLMQHGIRISTRRIHADKFSYKGTTTVTPYNGRTALQAAAERGHLRIVIRLLALGADVNAPPSPTAGLTALQAAAGSGFTAIIKLLLDHGADVNGPAARYKGYTALQGACLQGNVETADVLIKAGADIHALGGIYGDGTALHAAAEKGHVEIVKRLIEAGADVNACGGRRRQTPIQSAMTGGYKEVVQLLQVMGATGKFGGGSFLFRL